MLHRAGVSVPFRACRQMASSSVLLRKPRAASFATVARRWSQPLLSQAQVPKRRAFSSSSKAEEAEAEAEAGVYLVEDEYRDVAHAGARSDVFRLTTPLELESGEQLANVEVAYTTYGELNEARDNVILLCHALTGDALVHQYWDSMVSPKWTDKYFVVCSNILGSCYGTTGPASINPATQKPYGPSFPAVTMRDAVTLQKRLLQEELGVQKIHSVIGGSLGGMQTLEWAFQGDAFVKSFITIACGSHQSAWQIGMGELQRQAIYIDPLFKNGDYDPENPPTQGLALARQLAMMSYRSHAAYTEKFGRELAEDKGAQDNSKHPRFLVQSYLAYQGKKFLSRFDVNSYLTLLHMMDTHDVGRHRGGVQRALASLTQPALVIGVESDVLYPLSEQKDIASALPNASFAAIASTDGHDGFLLEQELISDLASKFLEEKVNIEKASKEAEATRQDTSDMQMTKAFMTFCASVLLCALHAHVSDGAHVSIHASSQVKQQQPTTTSSGGANAILYTRIVEDFRACDSSSGVLAMCASKDFVCRMKDSQAMFATAPSCLPYDPNVQGANTLEEKATPPWQKCDPNREEINLPTCRLSFKCMCAQTQGQVQSHCRCVPPDSVPGRSLLGESCGKSKAGDACTSEEYCKWTQEGEQVCSVKPYYS